MTAAEIIKKIEEHLKNSKGRYWNSHYIGISNNPDYALFEYHKIPKENHWCIALEADNKVEAEKVRTYFLKKGMRGNNHKIEGSKFYVYSYRVTQLTHEYEWEELS